MSNIIKVNRDILTEFVKSIFINSGLEEKESNIIAKHLVLASLRGVDSHGVTRVKNYTDRLRKGIVNSDNQITIDREKKSVVHLNGNNNLGIITATRAIEIAVKKAKEFGISIVGVKNSNHCGMLADYANYAANRNCIAFITTNAPSNMAPWGGKEKYLGTNPLSYGIPSENNNLVFDMATSVVARGKIKIAIKNEEKIPLGWAISSNGEATTDPHSALDGVVLPVGGPKGYGLALYVEILSGLLTGSNFGPYIGRPENLTEKQGLGHLFIVMRADIFEELDDFKEKVEALKKEIRNVPLAKDFDKIYLPGEIEEEIMEQRIIEGIPLSTSLYQELQELGKLYNVKLSI